MTGIVNAFIPREYVHCFKSDNDVGELMAFDGKVWVCHCGQRFTQQEYEDACDLDVIHDYQDDLDMMRNLADDRR